MNFFAHCMIGEKRLLKGAAAKPLVAAAEAPCGGHVLPPCC